MVDVAAAAGSEVVTDSLKPWTVTHLDCGYTLHTRLENEASLHFEIYESVLSDDGTIHYPTENAGLTTNICEVSRYAHGFLRFDGCMNMTVDDEAMQHFCGRGGVYEWAAALDAIYDIAVEVMPEWREYFEVEVE